MADATPTPTRDYTGLVVVALVFLTLLGFVIVFRNTSPPDITDQVRFTPQTESSEPQLEIVAWRWGVQYEHVHLEGQVKNLTNAALKNVQAVASFYDNSGTFITSDDALIDYNPIMPGQTSPFKVLTRHNPLMAKAQLEFKVMFGGTLLTREKK